MLKKKKNLKGHYCCLVIKWCLTLCDPHGLQPSRLFCPPLTPRVCSNARLLSGERAISEQEAVPPHTSVYHTPFQPPQLLPDLPYVSSPGAGRGHSFKDEQRSPPTQGAYKTKIPQHLK